MNFNSYIVSETKTAFSVPVSISVLPPKKTLKQKAFTLAEVLITLSIIGVVAAMTVPTLMANVNKQIYVTGLKKAYNQLQNAVKNLPMEMGCSPGDYSCLYAWDSYDTSGFEALAAQFRLSKDVSQCDYKRISTLGDYMYHYNKGKCFQTTDGMIFMGPGAFDIEYASIGVDINGEKGPNRWGRDRFSLYFTVKDRGYDTEVPAGTVFANGSKISQNYFGFGYWKDFCTDANMKKDKPYNWNGQYCAGRILETGKMDY